METKKCTKCGEDKALTEFSKHHAKCKECRAMYAREWRDKNIEKAIAAERDRYRNKGKHRAKERRKEKFESIKKIEKEYRIKNHEKIKEQIAINNKKHSECLSNSYISSRLKIKVNDCPPELIELKREQLRIHRLTKQLKQEIKNV